MTRTTRTRRLIFVLATVAALWACSSPAKDPVSSATTSTPSITTAFTSVTPTSTAPTATEAAVGPAKLGAILLRPADLPPGYAPAPPGDVGGGLMSLPCGRALTDVAGATAETSRVLVQPSDHVRLFEQLDSFAAAGAAAAPLIRLRAVSRTCPPSGGTTVSPIQPLAVGEDVAGLQMSGPGGGVNVVMVRSGPLVALIALSSAGPIPGATLIAVLRAVGINLAVGTGG